MRVRSHRKHGREEDFQTERIEKTLSKFAKKPPSLNVDVNLIKEKVVTGIYDGISTRELKTLMTEICVFMSKFHPDYETLGARLEVHSIHKETSDNFEQVADDMMNYVNPKNKEPSPLISEQVYQIIKKNADVLQKVLDYERDFRFDYFGLKTLEKSYLKRVDNRIVERPQHMLMRTAIGIHLNDLDLVIKTYEFMSQGWYIHATPTLFNSGTPFPQMSSCFLLTMQDDSIVGIYETLKQCAIISKHAGGIGLSIHNIRASQSYIRGTNGYSSGLVPMLRVFNDTARYVDQGGGKRKGSFAIYLEPWHSDIEDFLDLKKNHGKEEMRCRDLFYGLWVPDLFMKRVEADEMWSLFCPNEAKGLYDLWGDAFEEKYKEYENTGGMVRKKMRARDLWFQIVESQIETGGPYMVYKDTANRKSNQQNLGTIRSSNLCTEILEYTSPDEIAVCNLASIGLGMYVNEKDGSFDFQKLHEVTYHATISLNRVIDGNYYPLPETKKSNMRHRPIGLGVQGLADAFCKLKYPFDSEKAKKLNKDIFETIYFAALTASNDLAKKDGSYETFPNSPTSKGILQFDMWNETANNSLTGKISHESWTDLKQSIIKYGLRNSLLIAPMPTASTSQILGNNECFEPFTSNIYIRRVLAGEFTVINKYLVKDLIEHGLWNDEIYQKIVANNGSVQEVNEIPLHLKLLYRTVWEIKQKDIIDMAADRGAFIDQSQSLNIFMPVPTKAKVTSMHFYGWRKGLKTGMYYLRTKPAVNAIQFTVDQSLTSSKTSTTPSDTSSKSELIISTRTDKLNFDRFSESDSSSGNSSSSSDSETDSVESGTTKLRFAIYPEDTMSMTMKNNVLKERINTGNCPEDCLSCSG